MHVDTPQHKHVTVQLDLAGHVGSQPAVARVDPARLQRAAKGAGQSPAGRGHDVIQRGGMARIRLRRELVVGSNLETAIVLSSTRPARAR